MHAYFPFNRRWSAAALAGAVSVCFVTATQAQSPRSTLRLVSETPYPAAAAPAPQMSAQELRDTAIDAYVYAYPMVLMELARRKATAVQSPLDGKAPMNQFGHKAAFPDPRAPPIRRGPAPTRCIPACGSTCRARR